MSMPTFPDNGVDITRDQAFNMLLGSIAMEELALSHIMNAEGEKLQYVLGTLPCQRGAHATPKEILEVNQSISALLENVAHTQFLLKNKLAQVLEAQEKMNPKPCCNHHCKDGGSLMFRENSMGLWLQDSKLIWKCQGAENGRGQAVIAPGIKGSLFVSFMFEVITRLDEQVSVGLSYAGDEAADSILLKTVSCTANEPAYIYGSTVLSPGAGQLFVSPIVFTLCEPGEIMLKKAQLTIGEVN